MHWIENWAYQAIQLGLIGLGIILATRGVGFFSVLLANAMLICPYIVSWGLSSESPFAVAILLGYLAAGSLAWLGWSRLHCQFNNRQGQYALLQLVMSLGAFMVFSGLVALAFGDNLQLISGGNRQWSIWQGVILFCLGNIAVYGTSWGREWRAISSNRELALIIGVRVEKRETQAFVGGAILCAQGALAYAIDTGYYPTYAFPLFMGGITTAIIGGLDATWALCVSAASLSALRLFVAYHLGIQWIDAATFLILILFLIWKPLGFNGRRLKKIEV